MIITRFGESGLCVRGGEEHKHGGVEGLWAQRVSEWQTGWPFPAQRWQTLIRGNYKGPLARSDLILLPWWEPNVIMALGLAELGPSGNEPRSQAGTARLPTWVGVQGAWPKFFSETESHLFPAASLQHHGRRPRTCALDLCRVGFSLAAPRTQSSFDCPNGVFVCAQLQGVPVNPASKCFSSDNIDWFTGESLCQKYPRSSTKKRLNISCFLQMKRGHIEFNVFTIKRNKQQDWLLASISF